ncbi:MAG: hypothetical protein HYW02_05955 [Deltaproteobacteria bacterium]|nr:hypothetical protein [Deltaproteobacteria bacterium]MBI2500998.1 hypothetical protein [Deltaproteobacteria bacterium]
MGTIEGKAVDRAIQDYINRFVRENRAAQVFAESLELSGVGLYPLVDHITVRTFDVDKRAKEFLALGFEYDREIGVLEYDNWWAKVYRKPGYPAIFVDQAYSGKRGEGCVIPPWVEKFGDKTLHHIAVRVNDIEKAISFLKAKQVDCVGEIVGARGSYLRQIFTKSEVRDGKPFSVLELTERHEGYLGFLPPQADGLMKSSIKI